MDVEDHIFRSLVLLHVLCLLLRLLPLLHTTTAAALHIHSNHWLLLWPLVFHWLLPPQRDGPLDSPDSVDWHLNDALDRHHLSRGDECGLISDVRLKGGLGDGTSSRRVPWRLEVRRNGAGDGHGG